MSESKKKAEYKLDKETDYKLEAEQELRFEVENDEKVFIKMNKSIWKLIKNLPSLDDNWTNRWSRWNIWYWIS